MEKEEGMIDEQHGMKETGSDEAPMYSPTGEKDMRISEAADIYGDIGTAEEYGYVARGSVH